MEIITYFGTKMIIGEKSVAGVGGELVEKGCKRALIVCDKNIRMLGLADKIIESLSNKGIQILFFDEVTPDPTDIIIEEGAKLARSEKVDAIIAIGGGSSIDAAKGINTLLNNPSPINQYFLGENCKSALNPGAVLVLIPTTAGTGSEVSGGAIITDTKAGNKAALPGPNAIGNIAVLDPEMTLGMPPKITAATGMDVLAHAVETVTTGPSNVFGDMNGEKAIYLVSKYLKRAVENGEDLEARSNMQIAASLGTLAATVASVHLGHGLAHSIGAKCHIVHGVACAIVTPLVFEYVGALVPEKVMLVANAMGVKYENNTSNEELVKKVADAIRKLGDEIGIPKLKELSITENDFDEIADLTLTDIFTPACPREVTKEAVVEILGKAYKRA